MLDETEELQGQEIETTIDGDAEVRSFEDGETEAEEVAEAQEGEVEESKEPEFVLDLTGGQEAEDDSNDSALVKHLRAELKKAKHDAAEALKHSPQAAPNQEVPVELSLPRLDDPDIDWNEDLFQQRTAEVVENNIRAREYKKQQEEANKQAAEQWQTKIASYTNAKESYSKSVPNYDEIESSVVSSFDQTQNQLALAMVKDLPIMVHALANNPSVLEDLKATKDYALFAYKLGQWESKLQVRKPKAPPPEKRISGQGGLPFAGSAQLDAAKKRADVTGDYSEYYALKRSMGK